MGAMMAGDLYVKAKNSESLAKFAQEVAQVLKLPDLEHRESSNYAGGEYFRGTVLALYVTFSLADDSERPDFDFWISLEPARVWVESTVFLDALADLVARRLTIEGYIVARLPDHAKKGTPTVRYELRSGASRREQIVTREE